MNFLFIERIAEKRIKEAMEKGEFENLEGKGKPLKFEDDSFVPPDLRMAYKILKNAGYLPPEIEAEKEIRTTMDLLRNARDEEERYRQVRKLNVIVMKINMQRKKPINLEKNQFYYKKVVERVTIRKKR